MHYLYRITDILTNKVYIGQSNKEKERWRQHRYFARQDEPIQYIHRAMKKYGVENFVYEVIARCLTQKDADFTEEQLIKRYDSQNKEHGYNISRGGDPAWNRGLPKEQQPMYGKKQSEYFKRRMFEVHTGVSKPHDEKWREKLSKKMIGRKITWADKISAAQSGDKGPHARLTWETVNRLREDYKQGMTQKQLAEKYSLGTGHVCNIVNNKRWKIK